MGFVVPGDELILLCTMRGLAVDGVWPLSQVTFTGGDFQSLSGICE